MATKALEARIIGYTATYGIYQTLTISGKLRIAKNPRPINQLETDSDDSSPDWPTKPIQDLEDIGKGETGRNYGWHCPEKQGCSKGSM